MGVNMSSLDVIKPFYSLLPQVANPEKRLEVLNINCVNREGVKVLDNISFTANSGEILGIAGIAGSGQRELLESIAGLQKINKPIYEAASIDGAGRFQRILHVTLPGIKSTFIILLIMNIGHLMEASGFTGLEVEIPSAVAMVKNLYIWGSVLAWGLVAVLMIIYHLDKQYNTIITELAERENAKA